MAAYVVLTGGWDKNAAQVVLGPYDGQEAAQAWISEHDTTIDIWVEDEGELHGGYPLVSIISDDVAIDPEEWLIEQTLEAVEGYIAGTAAGMEAEIPPRP